MVGPAYPEGVNAPEVRMYTGYGMNGTIVKPPYSTLTAYDLNNGTVKWQVPAGGDDARATAAGARDTGYISQRTGIITTSTGLLFHAGGGRVPTIGEAVVTLRNALQKGIGLVLHGTVGGQAKIAQALGLEANR